MFERIDTVCLTVSNIEKASSWYQEICFKVIFERENYRILTVGNSAVPLTIEEGKISEGEKRTYPILFTKDIKSTHDELRTMGIDIEKIRKDGENTYFNFYDLDKNKLQVCFWA